MPNPNYSHEHLFYDGHWIKRIKERALAPIFGDLSQNENLSEIKLPLVVAIHAEKIKDLI